LVPVHRGDRWEWRRKHQIVSICIVHLLDDVKIVE
jgi:hypothetical protein